VIKEYNNCGSVPQPKGPGVINRLTGIYVRLGSMIAFSGSILDKLSGKNEDQGIPDIPEGLPTMPALNVIDERLDMLRNILEQINNIL